VVGPDGVGDGPVLPDRPKRVSQSSSREGCDSISADEGSATEGGGDDEALEAEAESKCGPQGAAAAASASFPRRWQEGRGELEVEEAVEALEAA